MAIVVMMRNHETKNLVCGNCDHKWNSHKITINTKDLEPGPIYGDCRFCDCTDLSEV